MSGSWMGKDYSGLMDIMNIYRMDNKREVFDRLKIDEGEAGKLYAETAKQQENRRKEKRGS